jgi:hypothetical protein
VIQGLMISFVLVIIIWKNNTLFDVCLAIVVGLQVGNLKLFQIIITFGVIRYIQGFD